MPTVVWTGTLSFGLVAVPVRLIPATEPKDVRFHLYDRAGRRVRYERVVDATDTVGGMDEPAEPPAPATEPVARDESEPTREAPHVESQRPVAWEDVRRGMENELGDVVLLAPEEIERVRPQRSRTVEVEDFVTLADIDPVFFEKTYYAVPQSPEAAKPYVLLHRAMHTSGLVGIGRFVLRTKPHLVAVRPMEDVLAVETLFFGDEVRDQAAFVAGLGGVRVEERELELALKLIETLKTEWDPTAYADTYREDLLRILAEKAPTRSAPEPAVAAPEGSSAVERLMDALKESVEAAKADRKKRPRSTKAG